MRRGRTIIILRSVIAALFLCISALGFASGRLLMGVLFLALAAVNVALTVTMHRRQTELAAQFPGLADRQAAPTATKA